MASQRRRSLLTLIFICCAISSASSDQVRTSYGDSDQIRSLCISDRFIMESYFTTSHTSLDDSEFRNFLLLQQCSSEHDPTSIVPATSLIQHRNVTGEGSHRNLLTSIKLLPFYSESKLHELVILERLPLGVFADPFELQSLQQRRVFSDVSVFGDTNLELPSFRSNRSVVEIHVEVSPSDYENGEISLKLPLHARYQPLDDSGYSRVEFGEPDLFLCSSHEQRRCLVLSIGRSKTETRSVFWDIPAGIRGHTEYVSALTFAAAVLSAISILVASVLSSKVESCKNSKQS
ncbi:PREDICTED: phosphatidylinositol-glycan biosynthesis class X protein-like isoform X1 [Camelina sativa]|uniref:Phosphatidylinositol-glycan biosynthesis class X protein-like isoform X1 n=1 Tax=Camelina sativa TaxID=90675 RepID=A0ABM0X6B7_CAMSA|nr:PREDICTED: phosphatidylinositol-glycan biosynthesis class X protein-like isoform X1 [Camelina sativa]